MLAAANNLAGGMHASAYLGRLLEPDTYWQFSRVVSKFAPSVSFWAAANNLACGMSAGARLSPLLELDLPDTLNLENSFDLSNF